MRNYATPAERARNYRRWRESPRRRALQSVYRTRHAIKQRKARKLEQLGTLLERLGND